MKIFLTAHSSKAGGGISVAQNLIRAFGKTAPQHEYIVTIPPGLGYEDVCATITNVTVIPYETKGLLSRWIWETFQLPQMVRQFKPDVIFNFGNRGFITPPCPQSTIIQSSYLAYPPSQWGFFRLGVWCRARYIGRHLRKSLKYTPLVFCQTPVMEKRMKEMYGNDFATAICPNQFSAFIADNVTESAFPEVLKPIEDKFRLFVLTRYYPHKNLEIIPKLYKKFGARLNDVAFVLTLTPDQHPSASRLLREIKRNRLENHVLSVGSLKQEELAQYYRHCNALFLPTLLESFSGTYFESMSFDCPILTSDRDFARYVCGDAAMYFDPLNVESIVDAILRLKNESGLAERLVVAGREQRQLVSTSWDEIAADVMGRLEKIAGRHGTSSKLKQ